VESNALATTYTIVVKAEENLYAITNTASTIALTISPFSTTISPPANLVTTQTYTAATATYSFGFDAFTCSPSCGTITYSAYLSGETGFGVLIGYLTFDSANRLFSISTDQDSHVTTHTIVIQA
jgi:hypothetical protein